MRERVRLFLPGFEINRKGADILYVSVIVISTIA